MSDVADRLDSIRERVEAATEALGALREAENHNWSPKVEYAEDRLESARSDVPYLLSLVEELREERDDWRSQAKALDLRLDGIVSEYDRLEAAVREAIDRLESNEWRCHEVADRLSAALRDAAQEGAGDG